MSEEDRVQRGQRARELLESDVYTEALYDIRDSHLVRLQLIPSYDQEAVRQIYETVRTANLIDGKLSQWVEEAKMLIRERDARQDN